MTKAMAVHKSGAYKRGVAFRKLLSGAASKVGQVAGSGVALVRTGVDATRDFAKGVAGK